MLIFSNGIVYFDYPSVGNDINEDGLPIAGADLLLSAKCYIDVQNENRDGKYAEGKFQNGAYIVSLDYDSVPSGFYPTKVRLEHERKGDLGEFSVQRIEFYDLTRTIQLWI